MHAGISPATTVIGILPIRGAHITKSMRAKCHGKFLYQMMISVQSGAAACGVDFVVSVLLVILACFGSTSGAVQLNVL